MSRSIPRWLLALGVVASTFVGSPASMAADSLELGDALPAFNLPGVDGKMHTEKTYAGAKVLVFVFTCNHCPTAQAYETRLKKLHDDYRGKGVQLIAVSPNDDKAVRLDELGYTDLNDSLADMKVRAKDQKFAFPYLYDGETQAFSKKVGVLATPHVFIFDAKRTLRYAGRIDNADVGEVTSHDARNAIDDLLAGRDVKVPKTRCFGCSTKWATKRGSVKKADDAWAKLPVSLKGVDAKALAVIAANKTDNYLLINVWATWCAPCVAEFPELIRIQRMYAKRQFKMVTVSMDIPDHRKSVESFLKKQKAATMANYIYTGKDKDVLADAIDAKWEGPVPHTLLIAPGGKVLFRKTGEIDPFELKRAIADSLGRTYASRKKK